KAKTGKKTIDINGDLSQWNDVQISFKNIGARAFPRNSPGVTQTLVYQQPAPVHHLQEIRVAHDDMYIYFFVQADKEFVQPSSAKNGLAIYIGTNEPSRKGWEGYEYLVRQQPGEPGFLISKLKTSYVGKRVGKAEFSQTRNVIQIRIPRRLLGVGEKTGNIYFKVTDGITNPQDIMDTYLSGSAMPMGRLSYTYSFK
ncbi:MAG TPA: hypothetical protein PLV32_14500, partial [Chitinophagaceae bacterium]|nr:hypothetical protein [Chitinophagaceae bacterium]